MDLRRILRLDPRAGPPHDRRPLLEPYVPPAPPPRIQHPELEALRAAERAREIDLHPFSDRNKQRWKMYVLGGMIFFPVVTSVFTPLGFDTLWLQILVGGAYGLYVGIARPTEAPASRAAVLAGLVQLLAAGATTWNLMRLVLAGLGLFVCAIAGWMVGLTERSKFIDGH